MNKNEVFLQAKLQHKNLVRLMGLCYEREKRILIYKFEPNSSLSNFLSDNTKRAKLNWESRYKIIYGMVRGLNYLHEESQHRIIHRDLKASNIMLNATMNAKIADFGWARLFATDQTHDTSKVIGTYGYMAPEYVANGHFSAKSDVYSFGVMVLEIVSGQTNSSFHVGEDVADLRTYAWKNWNEGTALNLIDPALRGEPISDMIMKCIHIGLLCVQEDEASRPTMASVGAMLISSSASLPQPSKPAFFMGSTTVIRDTSSSLDHNSESVESNQSNATYGHLSRNEASISEQYPR